MYETIIFFKIKYIHRDNLQASNFGNNVRGINYVSIILICDVD